MKEVLTSLISISLGTALLTTAVVSDKFKGNIKAISSLIIAVFMISQLSVIELKDFEMPSFSDIDEDTVYTTALQNAEQVINDTVKEFICNEYDVSSIDVCVQCNYSKDSYEITKVYIEIDTGYPISEIMNFTEKEFGLYGKVSVVKKSYEVDVYENE